MDEIYLRETTDLGLAAALCALDFEFCYMDRAKDKCFFGFHDINDLQRVMEAYWSGNVQVEPKKFLESLRKLEKQVYA